jgi:hypothetical protein
VLSFNLVAAITILSAAMTQPSVRFLNIALAHAEGKFTAKLTGQDEAPPTNSRATGTADFVIHSNGKIMSYNVNVNDIDKVIMANIYQGKKGQWAYCSNWYSFQDTNACSKWEVSTGKYIVCRSERTIERNTNNRSD